jgi:Xaa-Pro dipeptidase
VNAELETKVARLRGYCERNGYAGVCLRRRANFAWLSCGSNSTVERCVEWGVADLFVTRDRLFLVASEIERYRLMDEELQGLGFELVTHPWGGRAQRDAGDLLRAGRRMAGDCSIPGFEDQEAAIAELRWALTPDEVARARVAAREAARNLEAICREITPGMTEHEVAARLASESIRGGGDAPVVLVAFDQRMLAYRHPAPTGRKLERMALLVRCSQQAGLITSISRVVSFGEPEGEYRRRYAACAGVNAELISATRPGAMVSQIFARGVAAYAAGGYPDEWKQHHQGGALGYCCRDYLADAFCDKVVQADQLFAWNPSIAGAKLEDTILVTRDGQELLTDMPAWPRLEVKTGAGVVPCPDILVR